MTNELESDVSMLDITEFIKESWGTIIVSTVLGIAGAVLYLWQAPNQFEAIAQIKMAQSVNPNNTIINVEEPQSLIARLALPTSYSKETIELCGLAHVSGSEAAIASRVKLSIPKGVVGTVELKIRDASEEVAKECLNAIFQLIKTSQAQLIAPYINEVIRKLKLEEERLSSATQSIVKADKSELAVSTYLATRDEIRFLRDQISNLQSIIIGNENRVTHLIAPIYVKKEPVSPQRRNSLTIGFLLGGLLGLVLALARKRYRSLRAALKC